MTFREIIIERNIPRIGKNEDISLNITLIEHIRNVPYIRWKINIMFKKYAIQVFSILKMPPYEFTID